MKKKIIFGILFFSLITLNITLSIKNENGGIGLGQLFNLANASAENEEPRFIIEAGADTGSPVTHTWMCGKCWQPTLEVVLQPVQMICNKPGTELCSGTLSRVISAKCSSCGKTGL
jgi:hypothetical protein